MFCYCLAATLCYASTKTCENNNLCIHTPQDGEMIPYTKELGDKLKHSLKKTGKKYIFSMRDLMPEDAGLYQLDVEDVNMFSTDFKSKHFYNCT